jgi:hypothetical protein
MAKDKDKEKKWWEYVAEYIAKNAVTAYDTPRGGYKDSFFYKYSPIFQLGETIQSAEGDNFYIRNLVKDAATFLDEIELKKLGEAINDQDTGTMWKLLTEADQRAKEQSDLYAAFSEYAQEGDMPTTDPTLPPPQKITYNESMMPGEDDIIRSLGGQFGSFMDAPNVQGPRKVASNIPLPQLTGAIAPAKAEPSILNIQPLEGAGFAPGVFADALPAGGGKIYPEYNTAVLGPSHVPAVGYVGGMGMGDVGRMETEDVGLRRGAGPTPGVAPTSPQTPAGVGDRVHDNTPSPINDGGRTYVTHGGIYDPDKPTGEYGNVRAWVHSSAMSPQAKRANSGVPDYMQMGGQYPSSGGRDIKRHINPALDDWIRGGKKLDELPSWAKEAWGWNDASASEEGGTAGGTTEGTPGAPPPVDDAFGYTLYGDVHLAWKQTPYGLAVDFDQIPEGTDFRDIFDEYNIEYNIGPDGIMIKPNTLPPGFSEVPISGNEEWFLEWSGNEDLARKKESIQDRTEKYGNFYQPNWFLDLVSWAGFG